MDSKTTRARIKKLLSALELTASLAEISALSKASTDYDKRKTDTELMDLAPTALVKLNSEKLTKKEICALSFRFFGTLYKEANSKAVLVSGLEGLIGAQPGVLIVAAGAPAPAMTALPALLMRRLLLRGGEEGDEEMGEEEVGWGSEEESD